MYIYIATYILRFGVIAIMYYYRAGEYYNKININAFDIVLTYK